MPDLRLLMQQPEQRGASQTLRNRVLYVQEGQGSDVPRQMSTCLWTGVLMLFLAPVVRNWHPKLPPRRFRGSGMTQTWKVKCSIPATEYVDKFHSFLNKGSYQCDFLRLPCFLSARSKIPNYRLFLLGSQSRGHPKYSGPRSIRTGTTPAFPSNFQAFQLCRTFCIMEQKVLLLVSIFVLDIFTKRKKKLPWFGK